MIKKCSKCGKEFETKTDSYCRSCKNEYQNQKKVEKSKREFEGADPDSFVVCKICGLHSGTISKHVQIHGYSKAEYEEKFKSPTQSVKYLQDASERIKGSNNPGYQHGGKLSPFSKKFIKGDISKETVEKVKKSKEEHCSYTTRLDYYTSRGYSEEEAQKALKERQTTFSKEICIEKHGEEEGLQVWKERQEKWKDSYYDNKTIEELEKISIKKNGTFNVLIEDFGFTLEESFNTLKTLDKEDFKNFSKRCRIISEENYKKYKEVLDPNNLRGSDNKYDMDHKFSIIVGYILNIKEEILGSFHNLQIIPKFENMSKGSKCSITIEELKRLNNL